MERTQIPMPLQAQILMRLALAACSLIAGNVLLVFFTMTIAAPLFLLSLLATVSGGHLYQVVVRGHYLCLTGIVVRVERTMALRRPKAILMEAEGTALRVVLRNRHKIPAEGHQITFYIQDSTPIYEWKGMHLLGSYLAVTDGPPDKSASSRPHAKLSKAVKVADTSDQGEAESKALSPVTVTLGEDTKPFDKTDGVFNKDTFS